MRRVNTASTISQRDAYKLMLKDYPDVMSIEQMCEILSISTKTGYRILREGKICCLKVGRAIVFRRLIFSRFSASVAEKQSRRNAWTQFVYKKMFGRGPPIRTRFWYNRSTVSGRCLCYKEGG